MPSGGHETGDAVDSCGEDRPPQQCALLWAAGDPPKEPSDDGVHPLLKLILVMNMHTLSRFHTRMASFSEKHVLLAGVLCVRFER
jgi:hypothetical protein